MKTHQDDDMKMIAPSRGEATAPEGFDLVVNGTVVTSPATVVAGDVIALRQKTTGGGDLDGKIESRLGVPGKSVR